MCRNAVGEVKVIIAPKLKIKGTLSNVYANERHYQKVVLFYFALSHGITIFVLREEASGGFLTLMIFILWFERNVLPLHQLNN
jgi:hypothetical protein